METGYTSLTGAYKLCPARGDRKSEGQLGNQGNPAPHSSYRLLVIPDDKPVIDVWDLFGKGAHLT